MINWNIGKICITALKRTSLAIKKWLTLVKHNGNSFAYVKKQTEEICLLAVRRDGFSIRYVKNQTEEICLEAVKQNPDAIKYIRNVLIEMTIIGELEKEIQK